MSPTRENSLQDIYGLGIHLTKIHQVIVFYNVILVSMSLNFCSAQSSSQARNLILKATSFHDSYSLPLILWDLEQKSE